MIISYYWFVIFWFSPKKLQKMMKNHNFQQPIKWFDRLAEDSLIVHYEHSHSALWEDSEVWSQVKESEYFLLYIVI